ncbi:MAG: diguanylate cyclase [Ruminococcus sp.]|nr:diguanylate cyclase [Ruminococcus sp.]
MEGSIKGASGNFRKIRSMYILIFVLTCMVIMSLFGYMTLVGEMREQAKLISSMSSRTAGALRLYGDKLEDSGVALLCGDEIYSYNDAMTSGDEYQASKLLSDTSKQVIRLGLMDNYCDFALIYADSVAAGRLSDGTRELLCKDGQLLYPALRNLLGQNKTVWVTDIGGNTSKIFYIRAANDKTIFLGSFYSQELTEVISAGHEEDVSCYLLDTKGKIVICNNNDCPFDPDAVTDNGSFCISEFDKLTAVTTLPAGWKLVITKDNTLLADNYRVYALEGLAIVLAALVIISIYTFAVSRSFELIAANNLAVSPALDPLTGLHNAEEAENLIADKIDKCPAAATILLAVIHISNIRDIQDNYGTSGYHGAIIKSSHVISRHFGIYEENSPNLIAKTGENEFVVYADFSQYDLFKAHDALENSLKTFSDSIKDCYLDHQGDIEYTIGAAIYPDCSKDYDELYDIAADALKQAEAEGKPYVLRRPVKGENNK